MATPVRDGTLFIVMAMLLSGSLGIGYLLTALGFPGAGLVTCFWLFVIPCGLFGGVVLGRTIGLTLWARVVVTIAAAVSFSTLYLLG